MLRTCFVASLTLLSLATCVNADDWSRFRGPGGNGVITESANLPDHWSPDANVAWKTPLPGPGASSPIIVDGKVFVTCYSGYGLTQENPGDIEDLKRHLICVDLNSGKILWKNEFPAAQPEDPYTGVGVTAHGYASHTPVSDGQRVYAFFGKSGVYAFDMDGKQLWHADVGKESDPSRWGSSSSPILYGDTVIVTASAESQSIIGLDKATGKEVWRQEASGLDNMWGTPALVKVDDDQTDLVMSVAGEIWGLDPATGKMRWFANTGARHAYASIVHQDNRVYAFTGQGGGSVALDAGGTGDVSESKTVWTGRDNASFGSPVRHEDKLYVIAQKILTVADANTGKRLQRLRLQGAKASGGGRFGSLDYASPIVVGDRLFYLMGSGQMYVFQLGDEVKQVATNEVTDASEKFWGTPAVSDNKLVLRSDQHLYCVTDQGDKVSDEDQNFAKAEPAEAEEPQAGGRGQRRDPMAMFRQLDSNSDGNISAAELEGNRMAERIQSMDKDNDKLVSEDEFRTGLASLFQGSGNRGNRGGGRGQGGGENYDQPPAKPDRPQRPEMVGGEK